MTENDLPPLEHDFEGYSDLPRMQNQDDALAFQSLTRGGGKGVIKVSAFKEALREAGLKHVLADVSKRLEIAHSDDDDIDEKTFENLTNTLVLKALTGRITIPDWSDFCNDITKIYEEVLPNEGGANAEYIPELAEVDPNQYGVSVCTVDGQQFSLGDHDTGFCIQSCSKPISYLCSVDEHSLEKVHEHIGREPSGVSFNKLVLKDVVDKEGNPRRIPHNPMINAGAIMSISLFKTQSSMADRFKSYLNMWTRLCGGTKLGFQNATYLSEKDTADRNFCLAYMMREGNAFPENANIHDSLQLYFQSCCVEATCDQMSIMAATLANGGVNPITNDGVFRPEHVRDCLSLMLSCGMYDYSGEWAFRVGLPAKSGVGGSVFIVVPNVLGICIWSPRLDSCGNSVRGVDFAQKMIDRFNFHHYENLRGILREGKKDPTARTDEGLEGAINSLLFAAAKGDLHEIRGLAANGVNLKEADYDRRTALHLSASEGHDAVVKYLITEPDGRLCNVDYINFEDRWKETALDNAIEAGYGRIVDVLRKAGGKRGSRHKKEKEQSKEQADSKVGGGSSAVNGSAKKARAVADSVKKSQNGDAKSASKMSLSVSKA